jgi:NDP-sugar pyrophosphorylase family protein
MIFAAGLGTRLKPFTDNQPKALVDVGGHPMIKIILLQMKAAGIREIIINVHHFADMLIDYIKKNNAFGLQIEISDESNLLLDTGGGLIKASWFFDDGHPFLLHNVDVLSNIDFNELRQYHIQAQSLATLAVSQRKSSRYLLFNDRMQLAGWENLQSGKQILLNPQLPATRHLAFSGIHMIDPALLKLIQEEGRFSLIDTYLKLGQTHAISGYLHDASGWIDMGKPIDLRAGAERLNSKMFTELKKQLESG